MRSIKWRELGVGERNGKVGKGRVVACSALRSALHKDVATMLCDICTAAGMCSIY